MALHSPTINMGLNTEMLLSLSPHSTDEVGLIVHHSIKIKVSLLEKDNNILYHSTGVRSNSQRHWFYNNSPDKHLQDHVVSIVTVNSQRNIQYIASTPHNLCLIINRLKTYYVTKYNCYFEDFCDENFFFFTFRERVSSFSAFTFTATLSLSLIGMSFACFMVYW